MRKDIYLVLNNWIIADLIIFTEKEEEKDFTQVKWRKNKKTKELGEKNIMEEKYEQEIKQLLELDRDRLLIGL